MLNTASVLTWTDSSPYTLTRLCSSTMPATNTRTSVAYPSDEGHRTVLLSRLSRGLLRSREKECLSSDASSDFDLGEIQLTVRGQYSRELTSGDKRSNVNEK